MSSLILSISIFLFVIPLIPGWLRLIPWISLSSILWMLSFTSLIYFWWLLFISFPLFWPLFNYWSMWFLFSTALMLSLLIFSWLLTMVTPSVTVTSFISWRLFVFFNRPAITPFYSFLRLRWRSTSASSFLPLLVTISRSWFVSLRFFKVFLLFLFKFLIRLLQFLLFLLQFFLLLLDLLYKLLFSIFFPFFQYVLLKLIHIDHFNLCCHLNIYIKFVLILDCGLRSNYWEIARFRKYIHLRVSFVFWLASPSKLMR